MTPSRSSTRVKSAAAASYGARCRHRGRPALSRAVGTCQLVAVPSPATFHSVPSLLPDIAGRTRSAALARAAEQASGLHGRLTGHLCAVASAPTSPQVPAASQTPGRRPAPRSTGCARHVAPRGSPKPGLRDASSQPAESPIRSNHSFFTRSRSLDRPSCPSLQATSQPARAKKSATIDRPKVCCSPGAGPSARRGGRPAADRPRCRSRAQAAHESAVSRPQPDRHVAEVAAVFVPHFAQVARRRRQQVDDTATRRVTPRARKAVE